ncbi:MAG: metallophosphoesterase family protein [Myxococcota bacterium]
MFSIGHLSDLHTTAVRPEHPGQLASKRFFGWLSWRLRRRHVYRPHVLDALIEDLRDLAPNEVVVTGDLTNVALESEFDAAHVLLQRIGAPERVFVVPGNHDAYVPIERERSWKKWSAYMASDAPTPGEEFPTLRRRGPVAIVGMCSATPTPLFTAGGTVGPEQCARLERMLREQGDAGLCRIVLIHHPICENATSQRRSLSDAAAVRAVLARAGAELVLHGHNHRTQILEVPGPDAPIPVVGVRSASYVGRKRHKLAHYHVYGVEPGPTDGSGPRFRLTLRTRAFDPDSGRFLAGGERAL